MALFNNCPRCFYDQYVLKVARPRGIMATIMGGIDRAMKPFADNFAGAMPRFLKEKVERVLTR